MYLSKRFRSSSFHGPMSHLSHFQNCGPLFNQTSLDRKTSLPPFTGSEAIDVPSARHRTRAFSPLDQQRRK